jgi:acyl-CoA thioesterase-1
MTKIMWRKIATLALAVVIPMAGACSPPAADEPAAAERAALAARPRPAAAPAAPRPAGSAPRVVFLGDSLTAGLGLDEAEAFPALVERKLRDEGLPIEAVNAGVSGDTTAGGLSRLDWLLSQKPDAMVVGLGGNDGLRALPIESTEKNLREIVRRAQAAGARVLLLGMRIPPNYGPDYTTRFADMYPRIAKELDVPLVPFLLDRVGGIRELNQPDGIHPTAEGQEILAENVAPYLEELLREKMAQAAAQ